MKSYIAHLIHITATCMEIHNNHAHFNDFYEKALSRRFKLLIWVYHQKGQISKSTTESMLNYGARLLCLGIERDQKNRFL